MGSFSLSGGVEVFGFISPSNIMDQYPVIDPLYGIDGLRNVDLLTDLNAIPLLRRRAGMVVGVSGTTYYKLNLPPWTLTLSDWSIFSLGSFTGGTVTGDTIFTNGVTANTFSASTYLGLPSDIYVSGYSYSNNTFTIERSASNPNLSATINDVTGLTVNGDLIVTGTTFTDIISATTYQNLPLDVFVTGGTFSGGVITFVNNSGGTFGVSGISSFDTFVTGFTYNDNTLTILQNSGSPISVLIDAFTGLTINGDLNVTGTTTSGTISATTYQNLPPDVFVTGGTYSNNIVTFTNNTGGTFNVTGVSQTAFYEQSVWTSFQTPSRNVSSTNFGSGGALAIPFMINKEVTILNSRLECTLIATNPTNCEFAIYDVISGVVTNRLFRQVFQVTGTGLYTFPTNLTLQPGIYAWATTQDIILGWRSFTLPENVLGVEPTMGANVFISGKSKTSNTLPNPFGTQANYTSNLPLAIFEITT